MCLYPTFVKNPKYKPNKKNKGKPPVCWDRRLYYIPTKCGCCIECRKEKQREWRVRLDEELRSNFGYFTTLTIDPESKKIRNRYGFEMGKKSERDCNKGIKVILRKSEKRYREEHKTLVRYRVRRKGRQNTPTRNILRPKKRRTCAKTLEIRFCVYRAYL